MHACNSAIWGCKLGDVKGDVSHCRGETCVVETRFVPHWTGQLANADSNILFECKVGAEDEIREKVEIAYSKDAWHSRSKEAGRLQKARYW